ncbi:TPA: hypothetical protein EYP66_22775 [Candidatus Poribacteria bacterium]|nr:hypothetical protein [Candidatus Poribacteria bacterium]
MRRADSSNRKKQRRRTRTRCRVCRGNEGKRICPALLDVPICPICCKEMRAKIPNCDRRCRYFAPLMVSSRKLSTRELPLYKCLISKSEDTGMIKAIVAQEKPNGNLRAMFVLLDFWKKGLRDCFVDADISKGEFEDRCAKIGEEFPFEEIDFDKCRQYIKQAHRISTEIGAEIPWEYEYWQDMLGDMSMVKDIGGSLYKCAKCWADLPERTVGLMKQHAKSEDIQFYILCRKCGGQAEFVEGIEFGETELEFKFDDPREIENFRPFNDGASPAKGHWQVKDGALYQLTNDVRDGNGPSGQDPNPGAYLLLTVPGCLEWKDYVVSADFVWTDNDLWGIMFYYTDELNYYRYSVEQYDSVKLDRNPKYRLERFVNGRYTKLAEGDIPGVRIPNGSPEEDNRIEPHKLRVSIKDGSIELLFDDKSLKKLADDSLQKGTVAFYVWSNTGWIKNLKITGKLVTAI